MKKISKEILVSGLVQHPYDSNPDYFTRINFFHETPDKLVLSYYWEAPVGSVAMTFDQFDELIFILEGVLEIQSGAKKETFRKHDCLEISKHDGELIFNVLEGVKAFGYIYPADETEYQNILNLMKQNTER